MKPTIAELNLAAEARAIEAGKHAYLAGNALRVNSDTITGLHYYVKAEAHTDGSVWFRCEPDYADPLYRDDLPIHRTLVSRSAGHTNCLHMARCARRLERSGFLKWDHGIWTVTDTERARLKALYKQPTDPFKGLPHD